MVSCLGLLSSSEIFWTFQSCFLQVLAKYLPLIFLNVLKVINFQWIQEMLKTLVFLNSLLRVDSAKNSVCVKSYLFFLTKFTFPLTPWKIGRTQWCYLAIYISSKDDNNCETVIWTSLTHHFTHKLFPLSPVIGD